jgi:hypothetical protein
MASSREHSANVRIPDIDIIALDALMFYVRTTLDINDAVLAAAKEVAEAQHTSAGAVISEWARKGLQAVSVQARKTNAGFPVFEVPGNAEPLTTATVNAIIDDEGLPPRR